MQLQLLRRLIRLSAFRAVQKTWVTNNAKKLALVHCPTFESKYMRKHSGIYGHKNETLILQNFAFIMQFYTYSNPYDMN